MKTIRKFSQKMTMFLTPFMITVLMVSGYHPSNSTPLHATPAPPDEQTIMLALLLDTSNSMDGLIDQAKSQLWRIVNELSGAKCGTGERPRIRIALYEYGNDGLPASEGYVRMVSPLTSDLDLISEKLFSLTTNGGNEFCGYVINKSLKQLEWSSSKADLKMIFIAGNEPFTQGPIPYHMACSLAKEKDVIVNTIFCGPHGEGIETSWKRGADMTSGNYMSIEQNKRTVYIVTPYDDRIASLNDQLNRTYIYYGKSGAHKKAQQEMQDDNAGKYGAANKAERAVTKSSYVYDNKSWDLVDAAKDNEKIVTEAEEQYLPAEMKGMSAQQRKSYVAEKAGERTSIQKEIQELNEKRRAYIAKESKNESGAEMLDGTMIKAIREQARTKNLTWN